MIDADTLISLRTKPSEAKLPPLAYGRLTLPSRYLLSPLAGYTNLPFRRIVREIGGVGLATTDLVNARGLMDGSSKSLHLIDTCPEDRPFAVQLFGSDPAIMRDAAQFLEGRGVDSIDINMGCPVQRITKVGAGASMMCRVDSTVDLVRIVVESVRIPVTVKMRLGWDQTQLTAPQFAREFEQVGVAAVAIHGRTREQGVSAGLSIDRESARSLKRYSVDFLSSATEIFELLPMGNGCSPKRDVTGFRWDEEHFPGESRGSSVNWSNGKRQVNFRRTVRSL